MARPKSEDKKQALLEAATAAFAQSGIAASTSAIARSAGVAEGTLFRYFATKDELLNELYLAIKLRLVRTMIAGLLLLCATFSRFGVATSALTLVPATALIGYGQALIVNSFYRIGMRDISASDAGAGSAILSTLQQATLGLGPAILGSLFLALARRGGGNYPQALIDFLLVEVAMMLLLGAIALWLRHHLNRQPATVAS